MPKQPRNAFYYFMLEFRDTEKTKGITFPGGLKEVAKAASPSWANMTAPEKAKYENIAMKVKEKYNIPTMKFTSTGIPLSQIEQERKDKEEAEAMERKDIQGFVKLKYYHGIVNDEVIYLMDVNYYCKHRSEYLIGECTVIRFNLQDGIIDHYHEMINPGRIPIGYASDVKNGCEEFGLEMPDETNTPSNYMHILATIIDYLKQDKPNGKMLPPIFTMPDKVAPVQDFIIQMCNRASEDDSIFRIYKLDTLFFTLINDIKSSASTNEGFPKESLALAQLKKDPFKYTPGIGCERHEAVDKVVECTMSRTKRWAFTILDHCCPVVGIDIQPGRHVPFDYDMESIHDYKEMKKVRAGPSVAGHIMGESSRNSSILDSTIEDTPSESAPQPRQKKRAQTKPTTPLRLPRADYNKPIGNPPEITESNPPALVAGHGRGRCISADLNKMRLNK